MRRPDWTPFVLITASLSVTVVAAVLVTTDVIPLPFGARPGPTRERRHLAGEIEVWVGDLAPGLRGVLASVWGEPTADAAHDARLNEELALPEGKHLAWFHLLLFNTSKDEQEISLGDGALVIRSADDGPNVSLRSLAAIVTEGGATLSPALRSVLEPRGSLHETVKIPGGMMADLLVAFEGRVELSGDIQVASASGHLFRRRRMRRDEIEGLVEDPELARVEGL